MTTFENKLKAGLSYFSDIVDCDGNASGWRIQEEKMNRLEEAR